MLTFIVVIATISILMALHELGHFVIARLCGVRVDEFGIGYPPRVFGKKVGKTLYSLNLVPFGGFVRIDEKDKTFPDAYALRPAWQKFFIILGGVISFWILGSILFSASFSMGTLQAISDEEEALLTKTQVRIINVLPGSPADEVGLKPMDSILELQSDDLEKEQIEVDKVIQVQEFVEAHKGKKIVLLINRGKNTFELSLVPRTHHPEDEGAMGVSLVRTTMVRYPFWEAIIKGCRATVRSTWFIIASLFQAIFKAIQGLPTGLQFTGPVGVGVLIGEAFQSGMGYFFQFIALISIHLAIFNLLPIPAVDGGKLLFLVIEKIKGREINQEIEKKINNISFALIITLMIWVTIKDVIRLF